MRQRINYAPTFSEFLNESARALNEAKDIAQIVLDGTLIIAKQKGIGEWTANKLKAEDDASITETVIDMLAHLDKNKSMAATVIKTIQDAFKLEKLAGIENVDSDSDNLTDHAGSYLNVITTTYLTLYMVAMQLNTEDEELPEKELDEIVSTVLDNDKIVSAVRSLLNEIQTKFGKGEAKNENLAGDLASQLAAGFAAQRAQQQTGQFDDAYLQQLFGQVGDDAKNKRFGQKEEEEEETEASDDGEYSGGYAKGSSSAAAAAFTTAFAAAATVMMRR